MTSQILQKARRYEEIGEQKIPGDARPVFHLCARTGWMNDPNGFSFYRGKYHLFYQYHPYDSHWGPMHWGHGVSRDLIHWEYLPAALAPDTACDRDGCFSGSALELDDGRQLLMYTGVVKELQPDGVVREVQTQCMAAGDGLDYDKYPENPVLTGSDLPEGGSPFDFRDPKMWRESDGTFHCVAGNCTDGKDGRILEYISRDGIHWSFERILAENHGRFGTMWECPDFFTLDGKQVLLISPQDMLPEGLEYDNGNGTVCLIGHRDPETGRLVEESNQAVDYGIDFYAPQTVLAPDGRRILVGWMQNWDTSKVRSREYLWYGQMTLPRELSVKNGRLYQQPVRELETLRREKTGYSRVTVEGEISLEGISGRLLDMELTVAPAHEGENYHRFAVRFAQDQQFYTEVSFRPRESAVKIDRKYSGSPLAILHQRRCRVSSRNGELKLRIILDRFSAEVFINDGEQVMTMTMETDLAAEGISFAADGAALIDVVKYRLG